MNANNVITFTTDFGIRDVYASVMKGIILKINPKAQLIDITHDIPKHDILNASFMLANAYKYFPQGTIHVAVVDPGVGSGRKNIAIITENYFFIGPDNGIFNVVLSKEKILEIREINNQPFLMDKISNTFHGRDVFAPCAGYLSKGESFSNVGPLMKHIKYIEYPKHTIKGNTLLGEIVSIDSFGNLITNIPEEVLKKFTGNKKFEIYFASERFSNIENHYYDVPVGKPLVLFGSSSYLEISMNGGNASLYFMTPKGSTISVQLLPKNGQKYVSK